MRVRLAVVLLCAWLTACAASPSLNASIPASPPPSPTPTTATPSPQATPSQPRLPGPVDHVFLVIYENHAYDQIVGSSSAPYINGLIRQGALATNYHAVAHPSLPNYIALFGGSTFGITSDCDPTVKGCHFASPSLPDRIEAAGLTWRGYFDHMPKACGTQDAGNYRVHHDPFLYFDPIARNQERCARHVQPFDSLYADLASPASTPNLAVIVPGNDHNMHDGSVLAGDTWLKAALTPIFASPAWAEGRSLVVLTFDEDDGSTDNRVVTLFVGPPARSGYRSSVPYTHYSLLRTLEGWLGVPPLTANDRPARPMSDLLR